MFTDINFLLVSQHCMCTVKTCVSQNDENRKSVINIAQDKSMLIRQKWWNIIQQFSNMSYIAIKNMTSGYDDKQGNMMSNTNTMYLTCEKPSSVFPLESPWRSHEEQAWTPCKQKYSSSLKFWLSLEDKYHNSPNSNEDKYSSPFWLPPVGRQYSSSSVLCLKLTENR